MSNWVGNTGTVDTMGVTAEKSVVIGRSRSTRPRLTCQPEHITRIGNMTIIWLPAWTTYYQSMEDFHYQRYLSSYRMGPLRSPWWLIVEVARGGGEKLTRCLKLIAFRNGCVIISQITDYSNKVGNRIFLYRKCQLTLLPQGLERPQRPSFENKRGTFISCTVRSTGRA